MDDNNDQCYAAKRQHFLRQGGLLRLVLVTREAPRRAWRCEVVVVMSYAELHMQNEPEQTLFSKSK